MSFDQVVNRAGTQSYKWNEVYKADSGPEVLPLWVADMDFAAPQAVVDALAQRVAHPIYGYTQMPSTYLEHLCTWQQLMHGRCWLPDDLLLAPGVMHSMSMALRALTQVGDGVISLTPVYGPFAALVQRNQRVLHEVDLNCKDGLWSLSVDAIAQKLEDLDHAQSLPKALLFCNPHNPTGRAWSLHELRDLVQLCMKYELYVFADEIHGDLYHRGIQGHSLSDLIAEFPDFSKYLMVFGGPNKTFNLAGLGLSHVWCGERSLLAKLRRAWQADFFESPNLMAMTAAAAAYDPAHSHDNWVREMLDYVALNADVLKQWIQNLEGSLGLQGQMPMSPLEATYLAWWDCGAIMQRLGLDDEGWRVALEQKARVKLGWGHYFRGSGKGHLRFNLATPKLHLLEALERMQNYLVSELN